MTLKQLMKSAYANPDTDFQDSVGGPSWINLERFDVIAKTEAGAQVLDPEGRPGPRCPAR